MLNCKDYQDKKYPEPHSLLPTICNQSVFAELIGYLQLNCISEQHKLLIRQPKDSLNLDSYMVNWRYPPHS
jgi:hypothetical protein